MPTLMIAGPYRFWIVMRDCEERAQVHVTGGSGTAAKCWLVTAVEVAANRGYTRHELDRIERIARDGRTELIRRWDDGGTASP